MTPLKDKPLIEAATGPNRARNPAQMQRKFPQLTIPAILAANERLNLGLLPKHSGPHTPGRPVSKPQKKGAPAK
jgi:hypothetical protein